MRCRFTQLGGNNPAVYDMQIHTSSISGCCPRGIRATSESAFTEPRCQPQPSIIRCKLVGGSRQRLQWLHVHRRPPPSCIRRADGVSLWVTMYVCRRIFVIFLFTNKSEIIAWLQLPDRFVPDRPTLFSVRRLGSAAFFTAERRQERSLM